MAPTCMNHAKRSRYRQHPLLIERKATTAATMAMVPHCLWGCLAIIPLKYHHLSESACTCGGCTAPMASRYARNFNLRGNQDVHLHSKAVISGMLEGLQCRPGSLSVCSSCSRAFSHRNQSGYGTCRNCWTTTDHSGSLHTNDNFSVTEYAKTGQPMQAFITWIDITSYCFQYDQYANMQRPHRHPDCTDTETGSWCHGPWCSFTRGCSGQLKGNVSLRHDIHLITVTLLAEGLNM